MLSPFAGGFSAPAKALLGLGSRRKCRVYLDQRWLSLDQSGTGMVEPVSSISL